MVNINKIRSLIKLKGMKVGHVCDEIGMSRTYLNDVQAGKTTISDERLAKIADLLGTTPEYLRDEADEPENRTRFTHSLGVTNLAQSLAETAELTELYEKLSEQDKKTVLDLARRLAGE